MGTTAVAGLGAIVPAESRDSTLMNRLCTLAQCAKWLVGLISGRSSDSQSEKQPADRHDIFDQLSGQSKQQAIRRAGPHVPTITREDASESSPTAARTCSGN